MLWQELGIELPLEKAQQVQLILSVLLASLWVMWAFMLWDDIVAFLRRRFCSGTTNCPFCRGMHKPGECPRDQASA